MPEPSIRDNSLRGERGNTGETPVGSRMQVRFGLAARLSLALCGAAALAFGAAFYYDHHQSRRHMLDVVERTVAGLSTAIVDGLDMIRSDVEAVATEVARGLIQGDSGAELRRRAMDAVGGSQNCQSVTVTMEPADGQPKRKVLYCHWSRIRVACEDLEAADASLDPLPRDDLTADRSGATGWSEPRVEPNFNGPAVLYELPIYRESGGRRVRVATVSAELTLSQLAAAVGHLRVFHSGFVFVLSAGGRYLAYPDYSDQNWGAHGTVFDLSHSQADPNLKVIGEQMVRGETGFMSFRSPYLNNQPAHVYFTPLPGTGWSIGIVFADQDVFAPLNELTREIVMIGAGGLALLLVLVVLIVRRFTRPLLVLAEKSTAIAGGDLEVAIPEPRTRDEVGVLARSFAAMRRALRRQLEILAETRAAQARLDSELKIARTIQASFLPRDLATLGGSGGLAISTWFQPAREVGGDLYNCFWLEDGRLFLSIGDVAGKSVPAALMMAVTTTLVKAVATTAPDPAEVLRRVNRELCAMNEELLFVTLWAATLAPETGELAFANAGHNPPLIRRADGTAGYLRLAPGLVLGVEPDCDYHTARLRLESGDILLLYTDGLTEAMNGNGECFGTDRLLAVCGSSGESDPLRLVQGVMAAVAAHVGAAEQSDDLTLLAVARLGPGGDAGGEVSLPAELERLPELLDRVRRAAGAAGLAEAQQSRLELAVEEAWVNVCHYAYPGRTPPGPVHCRIAVQAGELLVEIADEGPPFDPLARPDPDIDRDLDQRQPGGLGIFLIKQLADDVAYRREDGRNVLAIRMGQFLVRNSRSAGQFTSRSSVMARTNRSGRQ